MEECRILPPSLSDGNLTPFGHPCGASVASVAVFEEGIQDSVEKTQIRKKSQLCNRSMCLYPPTIEYSPSFTGGSIDRVYWVRYALF
jgi:hypothetical protein